MVEDESFIGRRASTVRMGRVDPEHRLGLLDRLDVEVHRHRFAVAAAEHALERLVGLALISWCGTYGGM